MARQEKGLLRQQDRSPYKATIVPLQDEKSASARSRQRAGRIRQYCTAIILNVAAVAAGSVMGWPSPALAVLQDATTSPLDADGDGVHEAVSAEHFSWLASVNFLAGIPGTLLFGALADRLGRRVAGLVVAVPYALSWVLVSTTESLLPLYAARLLGGMAAGGTLVVSPLYVAETAEDEYRGALGTFLAVGINAGILFAFAVSAFTDYRAMPLVCLLLPAAYFLCLLRLPETPVYLVRRGRTSAARRALTWYRGGPSPEVNAELEALQAAAKREETASASETASVGDLLHHRGTRRALVQSLVLFANQQFCGVIAVLNFTELIFREAGSSLSTSTAAIVVAALQAVSTYLSSFLIERTGRRPLLVASNAIMAAGLVALGSFFYAKTLGYDLGAVGWLPVLALSVYVVAFAMGLGPVPLVLLSETYATKVRSLATAVAISVQTAAAFACTKFFLNLQGLLGMHGCLWLFAAFCLAGAVYCAVGVLETKGKSLDAILDEFHGGGGSGGPTIISRGSTAHYDDEDDEDAGARGTATGDDDVFHKDAVNAHSRQHQETTA